jgi:hypothetical protein
VFEHDPLHVLPYVSVTEDGEGGVKGAIDCDGKVIIMDTRTSSSSGKCPPTIDPKQAEKEHAKMIWVDVSLVSPQMGHPASSSEFRRAACD